MLLSKKEIVSIIFLIIALICLVNAAAFASDLYLSDNLHLLALQMINVGTVYVCLLYGISTWLFHSNYAEPRQHMRYVLGVKLAIAIACHLAMFIYLLLPTNRNKLAKSTKIELLFTDFNRACRLIRIVLTALTILLLIVCFVLVVRTTHQKRKLNIQRRQQRGDGLITSSSSTAAS
ncbi:CG14380 [Drosophila busckii]|uniref:CG14380 n=1 Tax=Drosophila busckii TaxID=30019 RepID=A0A0M5J9S5_DROBS|nr:uncharacterized protein LOC108602615 [Drosophila busckii]ALC47536.1 CG14380 [Drosophila busckii]